MDVVRVVSVLVVRGRVVVLVEMLVPVEDDVVRVVVLVESDVPVEELVTRVLLVVLVLMDVLYSVRVDRLVIVVVEYRMRIDVSA